MSETELRGSGWGWPSRADLPASSAATFRSSRANPRAAADFALNSPGWWSAARQGPPINPPPGGTPSPQPTPRPSPRPRLLLVEDDRVTYTALRSLFSRRGWDVTIAATISQALSALAGGLAPDAVVLDLMLPDGQGEEVLRHIRA